MSKFTQFTSLVLFVTAMLSIFTTLSDAYALRQHSERPRAQQRLAHSHFKAKRSSNTPAQDLRKVSISLAKERVLCKSQSLDTLVQFNDAPDKWAELMDLPSSALLHMAEILHDGLNKCMAHNLIINEKTVHRKVYYDLFDGYRKQHLDAGDLENRIETAGKRIPVPNSTECETMAQLLFKIIFHVSNRSRIVANCQIIL